MRKFSDFTLPEALKFACIKDFELWELESDPATEIHDFFPEQLDRLRRHFDVYGTEAGREVLIDAYLAEAVSQFDRLKFWKGAALATKDVNGVVDYLLARSQAFFEEPYLTVVEAKRDDFERGTAQCLVEMVVCLECNQLMGRELPHVFGIVTNAQSWQFFRHRSLPTPACYRSLVLSESALKRLIGTLRIIFQQCEMMLNEEA